MPSAWLPLRFDWANHLQAMATIVSAVFTAVAAVAAAKSARRAKEVGEEAKAARIQSAEPFPHVQIGGPYFTFSYRPAEGLAPRMGPSVLLPTTDEASIEIVNYGGGPALDLCITIKSEPTDPTPKESIVNDAGGCTGSQLVAGSEQITANHKDGRPPDILRFLGLQREFRPVCGQSQPVVVPLRSELLARLLPLTIEAEDRGYRTTGVPPELGRVSWTVHIAYKTALGDAREMTSRIYAERIRIEFTNLRGDNDWVEKHYICHLVVEPPAGFETSPIRMDASASLPTPARLSIDPPSI